MEDNKNMNTGAENETNNNGSATENKTYTQEQVNEMLQREADKRVTEALKKAEKKNAEKVKEAEKLAKMNEEQKYVYELEQREKAIEAKEKQLALAENKNAASKILSEKGISLELVDFVVAESAEEMDANIQLLDKAFKKSVKAEVEKRLGSNVPKQSVNESGVVTKEAFQTMSVSQQAELFKSNPELYKKLVG